MKKAKITKDTVEDLFLNSSYHYKALHTVLNSPIPDAWIGAGFVRNFIWDNVFSDGTLTPLNDIDVIYYNTDDVSKETEKKLETYFNELEPAYPWSVKNQARMHIIYDHAEPYTSVLDAISRWPEQVTAIAVRLTAQNEIEMLCPFNFNDILNGHVHPTKTVTEEPERFKSYKQRMTKKNWPEIWPGIVVYGLDD